jgi:hypothetical protein
MAWICDFATLEISLICCSYRTFINLNEMFIILSYLKQLCKLLSSHFMLTKIIKYIIHALLPAGGEC